MNATVIAIGALVLAAAALAVALHQRSTIAAIVENLMLRDRIDKTRSEADGHRDAMIDILIDRMREMNGSIIRLFDGQIEIVKALNDDRSRALGRSDLLGEVPAAPPTTEVVGGEHPDVDVP